ncbi:hypothetical protein GCM10010914_22900 [Deinococcus wulumuqiensis]|uniref:Uncharacterized protein n=1 Tax=Deinococcus wulumuqiensis TaxID=980427 RepID=A0AAV4KA15_9DEIO|nr:hypothetical protein GCM10010914_22900 [Deinococcus wulumuqiensis]GGP30297.1 hypothetical protein GCM10008021_19480 [Deinococcus wulumuqiensis]
MFPNPAKQTVMELSRVKKPTKISVCGVTITADSNTYSYQAKDISTLSRIFGGYGMGWTFELLNIHNQGGKVGYSQAATVKIELPNGMLTQQVKVGGYFSGDLAAMSVMAVRANDGKLQPLLFNNQFREVLLDPASTKKVDIYIKTTNPIIWKRMSLDVRNSKMTFYKASPFPTK